MSGSTAEGWKVVNGVPKRSSHRQCLQLFYSTPNLNNLASQVKVFRIATLVTPSVSDCQAFVAPIFLLVSSIR